MEHCRRRRTIMQPIPTTGTQELVWTQPRAGTPAYELYAGGNLVATLHWQRGSLAEARAAGCHWTFKRVGFWRPRVTVRLAGSDANLATFTAHWTGTGTLECEGEHRFVWSAENVWHTVWAWQNTDESPLMRIDGRPKTEQGGRASKGLVELTPAAGTLIELPLLVLLGWYLVIMHMRETAVSTGAAAATTGARVAIGH
jgi:hypothetical protein